MTRHHPLLRSLSGLSVLALPVPVSAQDEAVEVAAPEELQELRDELQARVEGGRLGCLSVVALRDGEAVWVRGFGRRQPDGPPADADTAYPVASVSKGLVGQAAAFLAVREAFTWDQPVAELLESFSLQRGAWVEREPTVRDLAQMTAAMPHGGVSWVRGAPADVGATSASVVARFAVVDDEPGREYRYSNYTSGVLECVVRDVSGQSLQEFLRTELFEPLGMESTGPAPPTDGRAVQVHSGAFQCPEPPVLTPTGGQGFWSTARDLSRFAAAHLDPAVAAEAGIDPAALHAARFSDRGETPGPGGHWLGWGHPGAADGLQFEILNGQGFDCTSCILLCPELATAVVCLTDTQWDQPRGQDRVADEVAGRVMEALIGGGFHEALDAARRRYMARSEAVPEGDPVTVSGAWQGTLQLEGREHPLRMEFGEDAVQLSFAGIHASSGGLARRGAELSGRFRAEGDLELFEAEGPLSSISVTLRLAADDRLVGSAIVRASSSSRPNQASVGALVDLRPAQD